MNLRVLVPWLACSLLADVAAAVEPSSPSPSSFVEQARALVHAQVIDALEQRERNHSVFSRAPAPPTERRVRILDDTPTKDTAGRGFVRFAVDHRWGAGEEWDEARIEGCVYIDDKAVFVDLGDRGHGDRLRRAADFYAGGAGGRVNVPVVCRPAASTIPASKPAAVATTTTEH